MIVLCVKERDREKECKAQRNGHMAKWMNLGKEHREVLCMIPATFL